MRLMHKLKNKQGASAVLGIFFFLICFFITSVIMSAASVNISRARTQREEQQAYLAINAADEMIRNEFMKIDNFYAEEVVVKHECHICGNDSYLPVIGNDAIDNYGYDPTTKLNIKTYDDDDNDTTAPIQMTSNIKEIVADITNKIYYTHTIEAWDITDTGYDHEFNVKEWERHFDIQAANMKTVHVKLTADTNYNFYFEMYTDKRLGVDHVSILKVKATVNKPHNSVTVENQCPQVIASDGSNQKGHPIAGKYIVDMNGVAHPVYRDYPSNKITYKTIISWSNFSTTKGEPIEGKETTTTHA